MYFQHRELLPKKEAKLKKLKEELKEDENKELRFHPQINKKSKYLANKKQQNKVEDRLIEIGIKHKQKQLREKSKLEAEENAKLKYHPQLEEKTKQIANKKHKHRLNEIPTSIPGINPEYVVYPRNKSADLFRNALKRNQYKNNSSINNNNNSYLNSDNKNELYSNQSFGNIQTEIISTISNNTKNNISLLDDVSSKYSFSQMKTNKGRNTVQYKTNSNITTTSSKRSKKSKQTDTFNNSIQSEKRSMIFNRKIPKPEINPETSLHDYLYLDAKISQDKKQRQSEQIFNKICPFTPDIPQKVRDLVKNKKETRGEFIKRMALNKREIEEIKIITNNHKSVPYNNKKEETTFKPNITRGPKDPSKRERTDDLNGFYDRRLLSERNTIQESEMEMNLEKKKIFLERSMNIILKTKIEKYKEIFNLLDSDNDGFISSNKIRLSEINKDLLQAMTPLFEELQEKKELMTFREFCGKVDKLLSPKMFN